MRIRPMTVLNRERRVETCMFIYSVAHSTTSDEMQTFEWRLCCVLNIFAFCTSHLQIIRSQYGHEPETLLCIPFCRAMDVCFDDEEDHLSPLVAFFSYFDSHVDGVIKDATDPNFSVVVACELASGRSSMTGMWQLDHDSTCPALD